MRFVEDDQLSFCLTISFGIKRGDLLDILGMVEELPKPQTFDDFPWGVYQPGRKGLLNVFEDGDFLATVENNGLLGVAHRTVKKVADLGEAVHYVSFYRSGGTGDYQYVEVKDGEILANFDPLSEDAPDTVADFFSKVGDACEEMIKAAELRMGVEVKQEWLEEPADTYVIDYRVSKD